MKKKPKFWFDEDRNRWEISDHDGKIIGILNCYKDDKNMVNSIQLGEYGGYFNVSITLYHAIARFERLKSSQLISALESVIKTCKRIHNRNQKQNA